MTVELEQSATGGHPDRAPLAQALGATSVETTPVVLPVSRRLVDVRVFVRREVPWDGELPGDFATIPNKPAFTLDGAPYYRELLIVRLLERAGWGAAWRRNWNGITYWRDIKVPVEPSPLATTIVDQITTQAGYVGSWDIVAWRDRELRLLVSRPAGGQRVTAYMAEWLGVALRMGIPLGCFAVVEHEAPRRSPRRRR